MITPSLVARVVSRHQIKAVDEVTLDVLARGRMIEAAAGVPAWTFARDKNTILTEGPARFPSVNEKWWSTRNTDTYNIMLNTCKSLLASTGAASVTTAEELAQDLMYGLSSRKDIFGAVGEYKKDDILGGRKKPSDVHGNISDLAKKAAISVIRKNKAKMRGTRVDIDAPDPETGTRVDIDSATLIQNAPFRVLILLVDASPEFKRWIYQEGKKGFKGTGAAVVDAFFDLVMEGKWPEGKDLVEKVAPVIGKKISVQAANRYRKVLLERLQALMQDDKVQDWMDRYLDLAQLGYGGGQLRAAKVEEDRLVKMAARVSGRYLRDASAKCDEETVALGHVVESAAGLQPYSFARSAQVVRTEGPARFPTVDPSWFNSCPGLNEILVRQCAKSLNKMGATADFTPEELARELAYVKDIYGKYGKSNSKGIMDGSLTPDRMKSWFHRAAQNAAYDVIRRHRAQMRGTRVDIDAPDPETGMVKDIDSTSRNLDPVAVAIRLLDASPEFKSWIYREAKKGLNATAQEVVEVLFDHMQKGKWPTGRELGDIVGISIQLANRYRRAFQKRITELMQDEKVLDWVEQYSNALQMGFGSGQLRAAQEDRIRKMAEQVAARFLALGR